MYAAKGLSRSADRCFAALSMTELDLSVSEELSSAFEPCLIHTTIARLSHPQEGYMGLPTGPYTDETISSPPYFSVIIAGAGPTGLTAANLLGMLGIDALVLERNSGLSDCPQAIAIDDEGLRICQAMGLSKAVIENVLLGIDAHYISGKHYLGRVAPTSLRNGYPLISTFDQPEFEATLLQGLKRF